MKSARRRTLLKHGSAWMLSSLSPLLPSARAQAPSAPSRPRWSNWSGTSSCQPSSLETPAHEAQLAQLLRAGNGKLRCVGAAHSFSALVATEGQLISLDAMAGLVQVDPAQQRVTVRAGSRLAQVSRLLDQAGYALANLPDIDTQTLAGAISTATHGSGMQLPALHAHVSGLRLLTAGGDTLVCNAQQHSELLPAAQVGLGSLGIITEVSLQVVPAFKLQRHVWLAPVEQMLQQAPALARQHRHFEFFVLPYTGYAAGVSHTPYQGDAIQHAPSHDEQMLHDLRRLRDWAGAMPALRRWLAAKLIDPSLQERATDRSYKLLASARPNKFYETEFHLPQEHGLDCLRAVLAVIESNPDNYFPIEFRYVAADTAWLSPFYQRPSCSIAVHVAHGEDYQFLFRDIMPIMRRYQGRPHWGKLHDFGAAELADLYPRWSDFLALRRQLDPRGRLLNVHTSRLFGVKA